MLEQIRKVREKLETEKSNSKKLLLSNLYLTMYQNLKEDELKHEEKYFKKMNLLLNEFEFYDFLKNDNELFRYFFEKCNEKYLDNDFKVYELMPNNKINLKDAKEIVYAILDSINFDRLKSYDRLYCFDKIKYDDLNSCIGMCYNTFNCLEPSVVIDKKLDKQVDFITTLVHELGHEYENIFMNNMSSIQQLYRYDFCFVEVMSSFFERVALDYLIKNRIYEDDANRELNLKYFDLYDRLEQLYYLSNYAIKDEIVYNDENVISIGEIKDNSCDIYCYNYKNDIKYSYGFLLGEYFFNIYRQDKKEGLKQIRDFLSKQALLDEREMLDTINFFENDYSFLNLGLKENMDYMRKRYKW